jgi:dTDP-4-dehydrorhamnose reductase
MRILITGASGMLGATLVRELLKEHNVYGTGNSEYAQCPVPYMQFNLSSPSYKELIAWSIPELIIHSGALTNGNYCNLNPNEAFDINGVSVRKLLEATNDDVRLIYISTDAVFPSKLYMAKENDCVFPENVYGKSKELGEFFLINSDRSYTIVRTTIVGLNENNAKQGFVEWIINSSLKQESIGLFEDVIFTPISIWELTKELNFLISNGEINSEILHIGGNEVCNKYEFGINLLVALNISTSKIEKGFIKTFDERAKRCSDQTLDVSYFQKKYNRILPTLKQTIETLKLNYDEQY